MLFIYDMAELFPLEGAALLHHFLHSGLGEGDIVLIAALFTGKAAVGLIIPRAVEVEPVGVASVELRAGEFGAGSIGSIEHGDITSLYKISVYIILGKG